MRAPYVRTGYEAIIPIRAGERFVTVAEDKGVVTKVTPSQVEVEYGSVLRKLKNLINTRTGQPKKNQMHVIHILWFH